MPGVLYHKTPSAFCRLSEVCPKREREREREQVRVREREQERERGKREREEREREEREREKVCVCVGARETGCLAYCVAGRPALSSDSSESAPLYAYVHIYQYICVYIYILIYTCT